MALLRARQAIDSLDLSGDEKIGAKILKDALALPLRSIANNAGENGSLVAAEIEENDDANFGFDALSKKYGNMIEMGVLDPVKVVRVALQNAAGRAALMLTTDTMITELKDDKSVGATA